MKKSIIDAMRYFLALSLLPLLAYLVGKETGFCEDWQISSKIGFFAVIILSMLCSAAVDESIARRYNDSIIAIRWLGKCFIVLATTYIAVQGLFFLQWQYAIGIILFIPIMWLLTPSYDALI